MERITGFSKLDKQQKIDWLCAQMQEEKLNSTFEEFWHPNKDIQNRFDSFSENCVSNFHFPFSIAPNFLINEQIYSVPMVIEESSVVAAAAKSAKFWQERGGFKAHVLEQEKLGYIYFYWSGDDQILKKIFETEKEKWLNSTIDIITNMEKRGGGITDIELIDQTEVLDNFYKIKMGFNTCDAMGANFINSVLEQIASSMMQDFEIYQKQFSFEYEINMSILSNYTPNSIVQCEVTCNTKEFGSYGHFSADEFLNKFKRAVDIAKVDRSRAVTHNKGILNGVDSVIMATGNDFRAVEACAHAYAANTGQYQSLSYCDYDGEQFTFGLKLPLSVGTVGGLTNLHPMAQLALQILNKPSAGELMSIVAAVGLAQNFGAVSSLITTGIQKGHMKMHLQNILQQFRANKIQTLAAEKYFCDKVVSVSAVRDFLNSF